MSTEVALWLQSIVYTITMLVGGAAMVRSTDEQHYSWTQPACLTCYAVRNPSLKPHLLREEHRQTERCCYCGTETCEGLYVREDPATVPYPTPEE